MSPPAMQANADPQCEMAANWGPYDQKIGSNTLRVSCCEFLALNSRCGGVMQAFPKSM